MITSPTVRVEEIDGCSSDGAERGRQMTSVAYTDRILSRAGVRARREKSPILCAGGRRSRPCSCGKLVGNSVRLSIGARVTQTRETGTLATVWQVPLSKPLEQPLRHPGTVLPTRIDCAHSARASEQSVTTGLSLLCVCNTCAEKTILDTVDPSWPRRQRRERVQTTEFPPRSLYFSLLEGSQTVRITQTASYPCQAPSCHLSPRRRRTINPTPSGVHINE